MNILIRTLAVQSIPILLFMDIIIPPHLNDPIIFIEYSRSVSDKIIQLLCLIHYASNKVLIIFIVSPLTWMDPYNEISAYQNNLREILEHIPCPASLRNLSIWLLPIDQ